MGLLSRCTSVCDVGACAGSIQETEKLDARAVREVYQNEKDTNIVRDTLEDMMKEEARRMRAAALENAAYPCHFQRSEKSDVGIRLASLESRAEIPYCVWNDNIRTYEIVLNGETSKKICSFCHSERSEAG